MAPDIVRPQAPPAAIAAAAGERGRDAVGSAAHAAVTRLGGDAGLVLAFASSIDPPAAARQLDGVPAATSVGLTGKGAIGPQGAIEEGCSAIAFADPVRFGVGVCEGAARDLASAGREAARAALAKLPAASENVLMLLLLDTPDSDQAQAIAGAYEAAGPAVPLAGGGAGGPAPAQLVDGRAIRDSVVAVALAAPHGAAVGTANGCRSLGTPSIVTRSRGLVVEELDGRPAAEVYLEQLGYAGTELTDAQFEELAVTHPLAQPELNGDARLRHVRWRQGGGLACATHIPVGAAVELSHQSPEDIIAAGPAAVNGSLERLGAPPGAVLVFDCAGRKRAIGGALELESMAVVGSLPEPLPPLAGAFTYGEVARTRGAKGDRNHAIVVATLA